MDTKDKKIEFVQYMRDDMCEMIDSLVQHALWRQLRIQWFLFSIVLYFFPLSTHKSYIFPKPMFSKKKSYDQETTENHHENASQ